MKTELQNLRKILSIISLLCLSAVTAFAVEVKVENTTECNKVKVSWTGAPSSMSNSRKIEIKSKGVSDYIGYYTEFTIPDGNKTVTVKPDVFPNQLICSFYDGNNLVTTDTVIFNNFAYTRSLNLQYDFCEKKLFIEGDFNKDIKGMEGAIPQEYVRYIITNTSTNVSDTLFAPGNDATVVSGYFIKMTFDKNATYVCQASVTDKDKNVYSECTNHSETFEKVDDTYSLSTPIVAVSGDTAISVKFNSQNACSAVTVNLYRCSDNAEIKITDFNYADAHGVYLDTDVDACKLYYYILKAENIGQISDPSEKIAISNDPTPLEIFNFEVTKGDYADKVVASWNLSRTDDVEHINVLRSISTNPTAFTQIAHLTSISSQMSYVDNTTILGAFYIYHIEAKTTACSYVSNNNGGFTSATAAISGQVTYDGYEVTPDVLVEARLADESAKFVTQGSFYGGADKLGIISMQDSLNSEDFSWQAWLKPNSLDRRLYKNSVIYRQVGMFSLQLNDKQELVLTDDNAATLMTYDVSGFNDFFHVTITKKDSIILYVNGEKIQSFDVSATMNHNSALIYLCNYSTTDKNKPFEGYIDDMRLWDQELTANDIYRNYLTLLSGEEDGLLGYWKFDEKGLSIFVDYSFHRSQGRNKNHGTIVGNDTYKEVTPSQLRFLSYTDTRGNYKITGVPFESNGTSYRIIPVKEGNTFSPDEKIVMLDRYNALVQNVNFQDVSSYDVYVRVKYNDTQVPASGIQFLIDDQLANSNEGLIATDNEGYAKLSVSIGEHTITAQKSGHIFSQKIGVGGGSITKTFHADVEKSYALEFTDSTRVRLLGKIVGGSVESDTTLGFGLSKNNIGATAITFRLKGDAAVYPLTASGSTQTDTLQKIRIKAKQANIIVYDPTPQFFSVATCQQNGSRWEVAVKPDQKSGEYMVDLLPEEYEVVGISHYEQPNGIDFGTFESISAAKDTSNVNGISVHEDSIEIYRGDGSLEKIEYYSDTLKVDMHQNYVLYAQPRITVKQLVNGTPVDYFGEKAVDYPLFSSAPTESLSLYNDDGSYTLNGTPVYLEDSRYDMRVTVTDTYYASATDSTQYPFTNGTLFVTSTIGHLDNASVALTAQDKDFFIFGSEPNLNGDQKKYMSIYVQSDGISYYWNTQLGSSTPNQMGAYVLGTITDPASQFITKGPDAILYVLRDPPGSASYATLKEGSSVSYSMSEKERINGSSYNEKGEVSLVGGIKNEAENEAAAIELVALEGTSIKVYELELTTGLTIEWDKYNFKTNQTSRTTKLTKSISTPSDPGLIGSEGDVYIGKSVNMIFSEAQVLSLTKDKTSGAISLNQYNTLSYGDSLGTTFYYTKKHIENTLLPTLQNRTNELLTYSANPDIQPNPSDFAEDVNAIYLTQYKPTDLEYGTKGSYSFWPNPDATNAFDEVLMNIESINLWKQHLKADEKKKLEALSGKGNNWTSENVSFDAGNTLSYSRTIVQDTVTTETLGYEYYAYSKGTEKSFFGLFYNEFEWKIGNAHDFPSSTPPYGAYDSEEEVIEDRNSYTQSIEYTFKDDCIRNYYSINVYNRPKANELKNGLESPVYYVVGGNTACPNFTGEMTKYQDGEQQVLHAATEQSQKPDILINNLKYAALLNLEAGQDVQIPLTISEKSVAPNSMVYGLKLLPSNNLNGLKVWLDIYQNNLMLDGTQPTTVSAYLKQGRLDITDYDSIGFVVYSQCQYPPVYYGSTYIADTAYVKLGFKPSAPVSTVTIKQESNVINTECDSAKIRIEGFDMGNYQNLTDMVIEYRNEGSLKWETKHYYAFTPEEYTRAKETYQSIDSVLQEAKNQQYIDYLFRFSDTDIDGTYQVRARADIKSNNIVLDTKYSAPVEIIKDKTIPAVIETSPSDGILDLGDAVSITFNEDMYPSRQLSDFISIKGVLNGQIDKSGNDRALRFNGNDMSAQTSFNYNMTGKSFTIEGLVYPDSVAAGGIIFAQGRGDISFVIGIDNNYKLYVEVQPGSQRQTLEWPLYRDRWSHIAVVYDASTSKVRVLVDNLSDPQRLDTDNFLKFNLQLTDSYKGVGPVVFGKNLSGNGFYKGLMRNFRLWEQPLTAAQVVAYRDKILSGNEVGLCGYWKMNELDGATVYDYARSHSLNTNSDWYVYPGGFGIATSETAFALIPNPVVSSEKDYTLAFWFKGETPAKQGTLLAKFGDNAFSSNDLAIYAMPENSLKLVTLGQSHTIPVSVFDNTWHHLALSVSRTGNANIYIDSKLSYYLLGSELGSLDDKLTLGATYYQNTTDSMVTNPFVGGFDNLRIWNYALSQKNIKALMHERSAMSTSGLVDYYPFDKMNTAEGNTDLMPWFHSVADTAVSFTNRIHIYKVNGESVVMTEDSTLILRNEAALVSNNENRESILPEYINQPNGLILSLEEFDAKPYRLQNAELTATVSNMRDLHGNYMNAKEWSFVVNNEHLLWKSDPLEKQKKFGEKISFDIAFINRSGQTENFSIENLPLWLTASETIGTIAPLKSKTITFEVSEAQPVGSFEEVIYLVGDGNLTDKLQLNMTVYKDQPNWQPMLNTDATMNIIGEVQVNGYLSSNSKDLLAAFVNDTCVGVVAPSADMGNLYWLSVSYPKNNVPLSFKFWSAEEGIIYSNLSPSMIFENAQVKGTPSSPILFSVTDTIEQQVKLRTGWTWISTNIYPCKPKVNELFAPHLASISMVKSQVATAYYDSNFGWANQFNINPQLMYMAKNSQEAILSIKGRAVDVKTDSIFLHNTGSVSWNWIGYLSKEAMLITDALALLDVQNGELIKGQDGFAIFDEMRGWMGTLTMLEPGCGYQYRTLKQRAFTYPATSPMKKSKTKMITAETTDQHFVTDPYQYPNSMNIFAIIANYDIQANDELGVFCKTECRGVGTPLFDSANNRYIFVVQIYGEIDGDVLTYKLYNSAQNKEESIADCLIFTTNAIVGTPANPIVLNINTGVITPSMSAITVYPNPVVNDLYVQSEHALKSVRIIDALGRTIMDKQSNETRYNLSTLESGCYILEIETAEGKQIQTIIKQ